MLPADSRYSIEPLRPFSTTSTLHCSDEDRSMTLGANKLSHRSGSKAAQLEDTLIKIDIDAQHPRAISWSDWLAEIWRIDDRLNEVLAMGTAE